MLNDRSEHFFFDLEPLASFSKGPLAEPDLFPPPFEDELQPYLEDDHPKIALFQPDFLA